VVAYAFVQDVPASWEQYRRVGEALADPAPVGLIAHVAGPTDEGYRIIEVWESEAAWQRFENERLAPAIGAIGGPPQPLPSFRDLHPAHIVLAPPPALDPRPSTHPPSTSGSRPQR
jgi:hypothetical protein